MMNQKSEMGYVIIFPGMKLVLESHMTQKMAGTH
jgi:hypothetical protein